MQTKEAALTLSGITVHEPVLIFVSVTSSTGQKGCFRKATESQHRALFFLCLVSLNLFTYLGWSKCVCTSVWKSQGRGSRVKGREQLTGADYPLLPCGSQRLDSGGQAWRQGP